MKRVGIYVRVSTQDQNCALQIRELTEYASRRGFEIAKVYEDKASGTSPNRKMFQQLLFDCRKRKIDTVIVWKLDRLFRSLKGMIQTLGELSNLNVEFISLTEAINLESSAGRLMVHMISAFAEFEADLIRSRVKSGLDAARARGVKLGRPKVCNSAIESEIVLLRQSGMSVRAIADRIGSVSKTTVERVLHNNHCTKNPSPGDCKS